MNTDIGSTVATQEMQVHAETTAGTTNTAVAGNYNIDWTADMKFGDVKDTLLWFPYDLCCISWWLTLLVNTKERVDIWITGGPYSTELHKRKIIEQRMFCLSSKYTLLVVLRLGSNLSVDTVLSFLNLLRRRWNAFACAKILAGCQRKDVIGIPIVTSAFKEDS